MVGCKKWSLQSSNTQALTFPFRRSEERVSCLRRTTQDAFHGGSVVCWFDDFISGVLHHSLPSGVMSVAADLVAKPSGVSPRALIGLHQPRISLDRRRHAPAVRDAAAFQNIEYGLCADALDAIVPFLAA